MNSLTTILKKLVMFFILSLLYSCNKQDKTTIVATFLQPVKSVALGSRPYSLEPIKLDSSYNSYKYDSIEEYYKENWVRNKMSGSFLVAKNGQIIFENYQGSANREKNISIRATTPIHLASVSKVLTANAILKLVDAQQIELDQKVNSILETFPYSSITIKMLLNHRSGLQNYSYFTANKNIWNPQKLLSNQDILTLLTKYHLKLNFKPDTKFMYCNTNYAILALIIEKITNMSYGKAMKKLIFDPLAMNNTFVFDYKRDKDTSSVSYYANNKAYPLNYLDDIHGDKNIYSTPRDLLKFDLATYSPQFLSPELMNTAFKGYSYEHKATKNYGLGIRLIEWDNGQKMFYHNGWWHGNTSSYIKLKNDTVAIIALSNKFTYKTYKIRNLVSLFGDYPVESKKINKLLNKK